MIRCALCGLLLCGVKKSSLAARRGDHTQILTIKKTLPYILGNYYSNKLKKTFLFEFPVSIIEEREGMLPFKSVDKQAEEGAAVNKVTTKIAFSKMGATLARFETHSLDAVPNIVGYNAITTPNPFRLVGSLISSPLLGVGGEWSPHTYPEGGSHLGWVPNLY